MTGRVVFVRHAESAANAGLKTASNAEGPLSDRGYEQALAFAAGLRAPPDILLASPYRRTMETARPILERFPGLRFEVRPGLREFSYLSPSRFNGTDARQRAPAIAEFWAAMDTDRRDGEDAESFSMFMARVKDELAHLSTLAGRKVMVVSHGQFIHLVREISADPGASTPDMMLRFNRNWKSAQIGNAEAFELCREA